jgi:hypothetical protein
VADASSLQFLVEEMLAHSAVEVGIPASSLLGEAVSTLPPTFRKRVEVLDEVILPAARRCPYCRSVVTRKL